MEGTGEQALALLGTVMVCTGGFLRIEAVWESKHQMAHANEFVIWAKMALYGNTLSPIKLLMFL